MNLGFYATLVLEGAEKSLSRGEKLSSSTTCGTEVDLRQLASQVLGSAAAAEYRLA
jgi:hypothetical protein